LRPGHRLARSCALVTIQQESCVAQRGTEGTPNQASQPFPVGPATGGYPTPPGARLGYEGIRGPAEITIRSAATAQPGYPPSQAAQRREIDAIATLIHHSGQRRLPAGLATTQAGNEEAFDAIFTTIDALEERLSRRRFLLGRPRAGLFRKVRSPTGWRRSGGPDPGLG
jgi:hypothetical protein